VKEDLVLSVGDDGIIGRRLLVFKDDYTAARVLEGIIVELIAPIGGRYVDEF
jgi:hypothetical protein